MHTITMTRAAGADTERSRKATADVVDRLLSFTEGTDLVVTVSTQAEHDERARTTAELVRAFGDAIKRSEAHSLDTRHEDGFRFALDAFRKAHPEVKL